MTEDVLQNCRKVDELLRRVINRLCSVLFQQRLHREPERERESNREAIYSKFSYLDMLHNISDLESSSSSEKQNHAVMKFHTSLTVWFASYRQTQTLASVQALLKAAILADVKIGVFGSGAIADCWGQSQLSCVLDNALLMPYSHYHSCHHNWSPCAPANSSMLLVGVETFVLAWVPFHPLRLLLFF